MCISGAILMPSLRGKPFTDKTMRLGIVDVTPDKAREILTKQNTRNRSIRQTQVKKIASDMLENRWKLTSQAISIDKNGVLIDGQHRLAAVVQSGQTVQMLFATDCEPDTFDVIDTGLGRTAADIVGLAGAKYGPLIAAGIKTTTLYKEYPDRIWQNTMSATHSRICQIYNEAPDFYNTIACLTDRIRKTCNRVNPTATFVLLNLANESGYKFEDIYDDFFVKLASGENLQRGCPILCYRQALFNGLKPPLNKNLQQYSVACVVKCFNYYQTDVYLRQFKPPAFPPMPKLISSSKQVSIQMREVQDDAS